MEKVKKLLKAYNHGIISEEELTAALAHQCSKEVLLQAYVEGVIDFQTCNDAVLQR